MKCEYSAAPFSTSERKRQRAGDRSVELFLSHQAPTRRPIICRKAVETATAIRQTFETVILCDLYPRSQIDIFITILQADGGEHSHAHPDPLHTPCRIAGKQSASINAATLALMDAGIAMSDFVVSCSAQA